MSNDRQRALAHARLCDWAQHRASDLEALGWSGVSATERMRQRAHGGDPSTAPGELTVVERHAHIRGRTLQVELALRALPCAQREATMAKYLSRGSLSAWARTNGKEPKSVLDSASDGVKAVGRLLTLWGDRVPTSADPMDIPARLAA